MDVMRWIGTGVLGAACLCGGTAIAADEKPARTPARAEAKMDAKADATDAKININAASKAELMKLEGVSAGAAQKIIAYRQANGPFKKVKDLSKVEGFAAKEVLEKNAGRIAVR